MGNVVYCAITFNGNGTSIAGGTNGFTGTLSDDDLPYIQCNLVSYYSGSAFILNIGTNGSMTVRNVGSARTISSTDKLTFCGSFIVN